MAALLSYCIECEDIDDLVIFRAFVDFPAEFLVQRSGEMIDLFLLFLRRPRLAGQTTCEWVHGFVELLSAMLLVEEEVWNGDRVGHLWELGCPRGRVEYHRAGLREVRRRSAMERDRQRGELVKVIASLTGVLYKVARRRD